jgi:hypothetical protein
MKNTEWPPHVLFSMHPAFWVGVAGSAARKLTFGTFEELERYLRDHPEVGRPDDPANRLREARAALLFEMDWYGIP